MIRVKGVKKEKYFMFNRIFFKLDAPSSKTFITCFIVLQFTIKKRNLQ